MFSCIELNVSEDNKDENGNTFSSMDRQKNQKVKRKTRKTISFLFVPLIFYSQLMKLKYCWSFPFRHIFFFDSVIDLATVFASFHFIFSVIIRYRLLNVFIYECHLVLCKHFATTTNMLARSVYLSRRLFRRLVWSNRLQTFSFLFHLNIAVKSENREQMCQ